MADLNKESMAIWKSLKPMIDEEIKAQTRGSVQRRKMKVTTAPSLVTNVIGVTEPYGTEMLIPFNTNLSTAHIGDVVWVEFMYGATNAFASMYASADTKDWTVGGTLGVTGNTTLGGTLGVTGNTTLGGDLSVAGDESVTGDLTVSGDTTLNGVLDVTKRRCSATLSSAGWYRVMQTKDVFGTIINFYIGRPWDSNPAEAHKISFYTVGSGKSAFIDETSDTNTLCVDKIRITYGGGFMYFDVHYNASSANEVLVYFDVYGKGQANGTSIAMGLASVADAPAGETVLTTHTFAATSKTPVEYGTANGWDYVLYADKTIEATRTISQTLSYYTTVGGFYGYYISGIALPFTMANNNYYVGTTWSIGNGFSISAGLLSVTTTQFNAYALATAHGTTEDVSLDLLLKGKIA